MINILCVETNKKHATLDHKLDNRHNESICIYKQELWYDDDNSAFTVGSATFTHFTNSYLSELGYATTTRRQCNGAGVTNKNKKNCDASVSTSKWSRLKT